MAQKRSAKEAFGAPDGQLSAAAAARQAKLSREEAQQGEESALVESIAGIPYNGHHSGTVSDEDLGEDLVVNLKKANIPTIRFSTVDPASGALRDDNERNHIQITLQADQTATFVGEYDLEVLKGVVNIYGAMVHADLGPQRVYALSTHALPSITARSDAIIRLTSTESGLLKLAKLSPLYRNIGCEKGTRSFQFLASNTSDPLNRPLLPLEIDEMTKRVLSRLNAKLERSPILTTLAIGPKSSGKSTFNRLLSNMIISRPGSSQKCWYLDLDPGQPEFGPPGQISLVEVSTPILGPSYTHAASATSKSFRLTRSHTLAATTFKDDAEHYLSCAADLLSVAASNPVPMVINSCGWTSGLGASTLLTLIRQLPATPEIVLVGESPDSELSQSLPANSTIHLIPRRTRVQSLRTPAEQRAMSTMAYFHQKSKAGTWNPKPLSAIRPWLLHYSAPEEGGLTAILSYGQAPHPDFLTETLDGAVVAIVAVDTDLILPSKIQRTAAENLPYISSEIILDPRGSSCLGLALIRGIDTKKKELQLLTPVDVEGLLEGKEVVLVRGGFDSPDWAYLESLYADPKGEGTKERPWVALSGSGELGKVWRVRRPPLVGGKG